MVTAPHPSRIVPNNLLSTREFIYTGYPTLAALPQPAPISILLHSLPLKCHASGHLYIATDPNIAVRLGSV
jgi:hypothetical protein